MEGALSLTPNPHSQVGRGVGGEGQHVPQSLRRFGDGRLVCSTQRYRRSTQETTRCSSPAVTANSARSALRGVRELGAPASPAATALTAGNCLPPPSRRSPTIPMLNAI